MNETAVLVNIDDSGRATLTMNRPELHNAFNEALVAGLTLALRRLDADPAVRLVILAANGKSFSAGADLNDMRRMSDNTREQNLADATGIAELMRTLNTISKPTIALVQGAAYGGGVGLTSCCDIAIATARATFCVSEVKLGLIPAVISPYVLAAIGSRAARRYFQTAEVISAVEAHRIGLVHEIVSDEQELAAVADRVAAQLLKNGPSAMAAAKKLITTVSGRVVDDILVAETSALMADRRASAECREGLSAFLEKRSPAWMKG
ncbi:MAG: enoyl-CoA hydratase/isomerase family protein [Deltaproteobacteria bacterium]|nr:enoyl-CoA hydratase/isomerase family protein [Deltaproteobacteria bacterium]